MSKLTDLHEHLLDSGSSALMDLRAACQSSQVYPSMRVVQENTPWARTAWFE